MASTAMTPQWAGWRMLTGPFLCLARRICRRDGHGRGGNQRARSRVFKLEAPPTGIGERMHVFRLTLILVACFALAQPLKAQVYKTVDKHGNVVFSDKPSSGSKKVNVGPVQTYSAPKPATPESKTGTSASTGTATADTGTAGTPAQPAAATAPRLLFST